MVAATRQVTQRQTVAVVHPSPPPARKTAGLPLPFGPFMEGAWHYPLDIWQLGILFLDVLRERPFLKAEHAGAK